MTFDEWHQGFVEQLDDLYALPTRTAAERGAFVEAATTLRIDLYAYLPELASRAATVEELEKVCVWNALTDELDECIEAISAAPPQFSTVVCGLSAD